MEPEPVQFTKKSHFREYFQSRGKYSRGDLRIVDRLLQKKRLPLINGDEVADFFGLRRAALRDVLRNPDGHYRLFSIPKKSGGRRRICAPREFLRDLQGKLYGRIIGLAYVHPAACGYVSGKTTEDCAVPHVGKKFLWNIDLKDFFASVSSAKVVEVFQRLGYPDKAALYLARICTLEDKLPQGAPTSPALSNQVLLPVDRKLALLARRNRIAYTRYADDLSFSANKPIDEAFQSKVLRAIQAHGFQMNPNKCRLFGPRSRRMVTGYVVNERVSIPRASRRRLRAMFHQISKNPKKAKQSYQKLMGLANWVRRKHPNEGNKYVEILSNRVKGLRRKASASRKPTKQDASARG